jgi:hypothetical protein
MYHSSLLAMLCAVLGLNRKVINMQQRFLRLPVAHQVQPLAVVNTQSVQALCVDTVFALCAAFRFPASRPMPASATIADWAGWLDFSSVQGLRTCLKINNRTGGCMVYLRTEWCQVWQWVAVGGSGWQWVAPHIRLMVERSRY